MELNPLGGPLYGAAALLLAMARTVACLSFLPPFGRQNIGRLQRNAVCFAVSLPQAFLLWSGFVAEPLSLFRLAVLGVKEALLGAMLGFLLSTPFWAFRSAFTLVDNQRGANAAQMVNPSLQADSSLLGELTERALVLFLIQAGIFPVIFEVVVDSYALWPIRQGWPDFVFMQRDVIFGLLLPFIGDALLFSSPILLLLLLFEFGLALASISVQGIPVSQLAMPIKGLLALFILALYFGVLLSHAEPRIEMQWRSMASQLFRSDAAASFPVSVPVGNRE